MCSPWSWPHRAACTASRRRIVQFRSKKRDSASGQERADAPDISSAARCTALTMP
ncbi:hypothetical protein I552_7510 [Mycobacterium xenopi 3993]|nr:hypothetical protein I552_7510 [Mycobacterium xenopi 3993]